MRKFKRFFTFLLILLSLTKICWSTDSLCGDANGDGNVNIQDVMVLINYLFKDGPTPDLIAADANFDSEVNIIDAIYLINYIFKSGPEPCTELGAVKGKVYLSGVNPCCNSFICEYYWSCPEQDSSYCSVMNPYPEVKVSAFSQGELVKKTSTDEDGNFYLKLFEGTYDIKIYPTQSYIQTFADVVVTDYEETDLGEPYYIESFVYQQLMVKYGNITPERLEEIMQETGNTILQYSGSNWILIQVPEVYHIQEMTEILMTNYPGEIIWAESNQYGCPA